MRLRIRMRVQKLKDVSVSYSTWVSTRDGAIYLWPWAPHLHEPPRVYGLEYGQIM